MPRTKKIIRVPRPPAASFNKNRPAGKLLQSQALHLRAALFKHMAEVVSVLAIDLGSLKTEGDVSDYANKATRILHSHVPSLAKDGK